MKYYLIIPFILIHIFSKGQNSISYNDLSFKEGVAFYQNKKYTGSILKKISEKKAIIYKFKNGLLNCKFRKHNEIFEYKNGIIQKYVYYTPDNQILYEFNNSSNQKIKSIKIGLWFNCATNDTISLKKIEDKESIHFKVGAIAYFTDNTSSFINASEFILHSARVTGKCGVDWWEQIKTPCIDKSYIERILRTNCEIDRLFIEDIIIIHKNSKVNLTDTYVPLIEG